MQNCCQNCNNIVNVDEVEALNVDLIYQIDTGAKKDLTDLEERLYYNLYCANCVGIAKEGGELI